MTFGQKYNLDKVKRKMIFEKTVFYDILYLSYIIHSCAVNNIGLSNILEQIKIVLVIYGIVIIIHMVSIGSKLPDLAKSTVVSFVVMASTYFGSAAISNIILSLKGMI